MVEILFYHLQPQPIEQVLPVLLQKTLAKGWKAIIETPLLERVKALDDHLWMFSEEGFLPHATSADADAVYDPILILSDSSNPIAAQVRFCIDQAPIPDDISGYERIIIMFDGNDSDALNHARAQWKHAKSLNADATYWQQDDEGRWVKKQ